MDLEGKLTMLKTSTNPSMFGDMEDEVVGKLVFEPTLQKSLWFHMENYKFRVTSPVVGITMLDDCMIVKTWNSTYKFTPYTG